VLAAAYAATRDLEGSRQLLDAELAAGFPIPEDSNWSTAHQCWAESAVVLRHAEAAAKNSAPPYVSSTLAAWAELLAERGRADDHSRARAMAEGALQTASGRGHGNVEHDAIAVLERLP